MSRFKSKISRAFFLFPLCLLTTSLSLEAASAGAGVNVGPVDVGAGVGAGPGGVGAGVGVGPVGVGVGVGGRVDQRGYGYPQGTYYNDYNQGYNYPQDYQTQGYYTNQQGYQQGNQQGWRGYDQRDGRYRGNYPSNSNTGYYYSSPNNNYSNPNSPYPNEYYQQNGQYRNGVGAGAYIQAR